MSIKEVSLNGKNLPIRPFKLEWLDENPSICMIAKRNSGKSWVCRDILMHFRHIPGGVIISQTENTKPFYGRFFPNLYIHHAYSSELLEDVFARQEAIIEKCKDRYKKHKKVDPRAFLVMDDCLSSKGTWMNDPPLLRVFYEGRHSQLLYLLSMQFPLGIKPELRSNLDYIFLLADDYYGNQKRLHDHYAGMFPSFESFRQVFQQLTADYGCMVIANKGARQHFLDKVFWYKSNGDMGKKVGSKQFYDFHYNNYNKDWKKKPKILDIDNFRNAKKKRIVVNKVLN